MSSCLLKAENIHKSFRHPEKIELLKGVSLTAARGQSIAILGASGEGKTTLLHILGLIETFDKGSLEIASNTRFNDRMRATLIGMIFQNFNLIEDLTVLENLLLSNRIAKKTPDLQKAAALLEDINLTKRTLFLAKKLSGGEKQRAAIARALMNDPQLILADEPTGNLDSHNSKIVQNLLFSSIKKHNKSLILATHNEGLARQCDELYLLKEGCLQKC